MEKYTTNNYTQGEIEHSKTENEDSTLHESLLYTYEQEDETPSYILGYNWAKAASNINNWSGFKTSV